MMTGNCSPAACETARDSRSASEPIVVGLGSANGDDQIGWLIADEIARLLGPGITVRNLTTPIDLTCAFDGFQRAVIIDAVRSDRVSALPQRWEWPTPEIALLRASGTHAIGLPETLEIAAQLHRLPDQVVIWGVPGQCFSTGSPVNPTLQQAVPALARTIIECDLQTTCSSR